MKEIEKELFELLVVLNSKTPEELEEFGKIWSQEMQRRNAPDRIVKFTKLVIETVLQRKIGAEE